jgi:hypothetical protein
MLVKQARTVPCHFVAKKAKNGLLVARNTVTLVLISSASVAKINAMAEGEKSN